MAVAGSGAEGRADGQARLAAFAQPSGLATDGDRLFVADSESSCARAVTFGTGGPAVVTLAGGDLFGEVDGSGDDERFQHPLGLTFAPRSAPGGAALYVADTYNNAIRCLGPATRTVVTRAGGESASLAEAGGISDAAGRLRV